MTRRINEGDLDSLVITGDVFIVPNQAYKLQECNEGWREDKRKDLEGILKANGKVLNEDEEYCMECWYLSEEMDCENIPDHGIDTETDDDREVRITVPSHRTLPASLFAPYKEGDVVSVKIPTYIRIADGFRGMKNVTYNLKLVQRHYRYCNFGNFEDLLRRVCVGNNFN